MSTLVPAVKNAFRRTADRLAGRHVPVRSGEPPTEIWTGRPVRTPKIDVLEREGELRLVLDVPGAVQDRVTVTSAKSGVLTVHAERVGAHDWHLSLSLPPYADSAQARSALERGVLTIDMPLQPREAAVHRIPVRSSE